LAGNERGHPEGILLHKSWEGKPQRGVKGDVYLRWGKRLFHKHLKPLL